MTQCYLLIFSSAAFLASVMGLHDEAGAKKSTSNKQTSAAVLPANLFLEKEPEGAKPVEEIKSSAKVGDKIVIRGRIGGSKSPFVSKRAVFTLMGAGLKACSDKAEDKCCDTPWDYCCDTPEAIAKHSATIQIVDGEGAPLRTGLKGANGLQELSEVVIEGVVKESKDKMLLINATGMFLVPKKDSK